MDDPRWRLMLLGDGGGGNNGAALDGGDWRAQLPPDSRQRIVNKIMETLKRHLPVSGPEGLQELNKIARRFEEKIYTAAISQTDYLRKISLKMLTMETKSQSTIPNALPSSSAGNSSKDSGKRARISPSNQDETQHPMDYISQLPDDIIFRIFSFLTTKDTVRTSVLSKRWHSTWKSNQYMSFSLPRGSSRKSKSFITFVNSVLSRLPDIKVKSFLIDAPCLTLMQPSLDGWLQFAIKHDVEELSVTLHYRRRRKIYALPQILFRCTTLVSLCVSQCCFPVFDTVNWCSLKTLRIEHAELNDDGMVRVLSGSPVLEFLELKSCMGVKHIMVGSKSFKELVIDSHKFREQCPILKISAPHLLKLRLLGNSQGGEFRLDEVSSLIEAELNFVMKTLALDEVKADGDLVKGLLKSLHHVPKLMMGSWCLQVLSLMEAGELSLPSLECQHLTLLSAVDHEGACVIAEILESTPCLEKLFLQLTCTPNSATEFRMESIGCHDFDGEEYWNSAKWRIYQCLMHLKHVEIVDRGANLLGWEPVLSLLKFLLQHAIWLDKMVIDSTNSESSQAVDPWGLLEVAQILMSHPKGSPSAKVILRYPPQGSRSRRVRKS